MQQEDGSSGINIIEYESMKKQLISPSSSLSILPCSGKVLNGKKCNCWRRNKLVKV